jgi:indole-3-glycerol phosphate synthase
VLGEIVESTRAEVARRRRQRSEQSLRRELTGEQRSGERGPGRFAIALDAPGIGVIAEFKRRSPSAGVLREGADASEIAQAYESGGACALSVLTEGPHFDGSLEDLRAARGASRLPILRKDFIVDSYQLYEARLAGADAVLLIVAALDRAELAALHEQARGLGLDVLVEVHDRDELHVALELEAAVIGINNRDLRDFSVDVERTAQLMQHVPTQTRVVSESGIRGRGQLTSLELNGVAAVLVGEALMRSADPEAALAQLIPGGGGATSPAAAGPGTPLENI